MKYIKHIGVITLLACAIACKQQTADNSEKTAGPEKPLRIGMVTGLKPEKAAYYKELHANTWEGVLKKLKECNVRNYSIYLQEIEGNYYLFSYYEYTGDNYEADMKKIAADTTTQRWWTETDPCQIPLPQAAAEGKIWAGMEEVFHMD
ncbi:L-rhamnose mutarotase [Anseongella ginsenosidimutans]|uniref:L-rhamnose mutarotase n=1 Tax=Anseongella ginsenosidimutans TaxID=496056 RepID=A0A4R3KS78_9SPHI|nr:L-rhamnose mutarotase [Anseongella ginsenosidimutans]QEC53058.1 L-rhamnose mutarotase [Anseongella ginsenosidimutans]TCS87673.1 L-rhamnose mutarotase [Anseongella ginsenosidimutans]